MVHSAQVGLSKVTGLVATHPCVQISPLMEHIAQARRSASSTLLTQAHGLTQSRV